MTRTYWVSRRSFVAKVCPPSVILTALTAPIPPATNFNQPASLSTVHVVRRTTQRAQSPILAQFLISNAQSPVNAQFSAGLNSWTTPAFTQIAPLTQNWIAVALGAPAVTPNPLPQPYLDYALDTFHAGPLPPQVSVNYGWVVPVFNPGIAPPPPPPTPGVPFNLPRFTLQVSLPNWDHVVIYKPKNFTFTAVLP